MSDYERGESAFPQRERPSEADEGQLDAGAEFAEPSVEAALPEADAPEEPEPGVEEPEPGLEEPEPGVEEPEPGVEEPEPGVEEPEPDEDPFASWPEARSATVIEDMPDEGVSVEHVRGEIDVPDGYTVFEGSPSGMRRTVAVVVSRFNGGLTNRMLARALEALEEAGVDQESVTVMAVPGAFELPLAAMAMAKTRRYACVVALGAIVRGETPHFDYIASEAASGLQLAAIETGIPVSFGVLTVETVAQGEARVERAADAVRSALEMADVFAQLRASARAS